MARKPSSQVFGGVIMIKETPVMNSKASNFCFQGSEDPFPTRMTEEEFRASVALTTKGEDGYFIHKVIHAGRIVKVCQWPAGKFDPPVATGVQA